MSQKKYFGTDGIRGRVGDSKINPEFALKLGWAVGKILAHEKNAKILIGKDTRNSCAMLESALTSGLSAAGVNTFLLGILPTPAIAYLTHSLRATAGIVISASHNLYPDNGIKFFDEKGMKLSNELEQEIEIQIEHPMSTINTEHLGRIETIIDARGRYIEFCKSAFPSELNLNGLKLVIDCANGATYDVAPKIFYELGAEVIIINHEPDGFNINKKCGAIDVRALQKRVMDENAQVGVAFDGDGDRLIMVDHNGEKVDGDEILCIFAKDLFSRERNSRGIVGTVMSNLGLEIALKEMEIPFTRTAVGDRYVSEELVKRGWKLGGEASGHIVNFNHTTTGDGIITALQILRVIQSTGKSLHELKKVMSKCPQVLINVPVFGDKDLHQYPKVIQAVKEIEKTLDEKGRVLLRNSGTESCVRVMVEGRDEGEVRKMAEFLAGVVERELG